MVVLGMVVLGMVVLGTVGVPTDLLSIRLQYGLIINMIFVRGIIRSAGNKKLAQKHVQ
jgi:hypothetical protein